MVFLPKTEFSPKSRDGQKCKRVQYCAIELAPQQLNLKTEVKLRPEPIHATASHFHAQNHVEPARWTG